MTGVHRKIDQREERRERKALIAAKLELSIEKELVERLAKGTYGDIYNFPEVPYQKALQSVEKEEEEEEVETEEESEEESITEYVEDLEEDEEEDIEDMEYIGNGNWGEDSASEEESAASEEESDDNESTSEDEKPAKQKPAVKQPKRGTRVEIEYEEEHEEEQKVQEETVAGMAW
jgi:protein MAK16